jgi:type II secretory pathway component PulC
VVQISLGALAAYLIYGTVAPLVGETSVPEAVVPEAVPVSEQAYERERYRVITERNLFRTPEVAPEPEPEPPPEEAIAESDLKLTLLGTAVFGSPDLSTAVVTRAGSGEVQVVRIGDEIEGATVERIERRRLVVRNRGKLEQISLDVQKASGPGVNHRATSTQERVRQARERALARRQAAREARAKRATRRQTAGRRPVPEEEEARVQAESMAALGDIQIEDGESIVSINGIPVEDQEALLDSAEPPWRILISDENGNEREVVIGENP